jgi:hypothetical protein
MQVWTGFRNATDLTKIFCPDRTSTSDEAVVLLWGLGDDDNTYDIQLFEEVSAYVWLLACVSQDFKAPLIYYQMRWTEKISAWPVGLLSALASISTSIYSPPQSNNPLRSPTGEPALIVSEISKIK